MSRQNRFGPRFAREFTAYSYYFMLSNILFYLSILVPGAWIVFTTPNFFDVVAIGLMLPGLAALVSCTIKFRESDEKATFGVFKEFIERYKNNFRDTIKYCFVYALVVFTVFFTVRHGDDLSLFMRVSLIVSTSVSTLIVTYMMIVAARFEFKKTRHLLRVSLYCCLMHFKITAVLAVAYFVLLFLTLWFGLLMLFLFASPILYGIIRLTYPVLDDVYEMFIEKGDGGEAV
ncbi:MAG: DUF624 domain-containing protein [Turicibacter sp.]|nr:DUF624 domain-containing protein [Turicibacter sp.]